jgi:RsiW-degrading membrane proteinase PrsW (M82 family)
MWHNIWNTVLAFAKVTLITIVVIGVAPIGLRRLLAQGGRDA